MSVLEDFRQKNPAYKDWDDKRLADGLYKKYYASRMSRAEFDAKMGAKMQTPDPVPLPAPQPDRSGFGWGLADNIVNAFTGNQLPRIGAAFGATTESIKDLVTGQDVDWGGAFKEREDLLRGERSQFRQKTPALSIGTEFVGGMVSPLGALSKLGAFRGGLTAGGIYASGEAASNDPRAILRDTGIGAAAGGAGGKVLEQFIKYGTPAAKAVWNRVSSKIAGKSNDPRIAFNEVIKAIQRDFPDLPPMEATQKAEQVVMSLGDEAVLADAGPNLRSLFGSAARRGGEGKKIAEEFLENRQQGPINPQTHMREGGQSARIVRAIDDLAPDDFTASQAGTKAARAAETRPQYAQIVENPANKMPSKVDVRSVYGTRQIQNTPFDDLMKDPFYESHFRGAMNSNLYPTRGQPKNSLVVIDAAQKTISDLEKAALRANKVNRARELGNRRRALLEMVDKQFPEYAAIREVWRDYSEVLDAGDLGRKFMNGDIDDIIPRINQMQPKELKQFQRGAARALRQRIQKMKRTHNATEPLVDVTELDMKMSAAFGDRLPPYLQKLRGEIEKFKTYAEVLRGSQTSERVAADRVLDGARDPGIAGAATAAGMDAALAATTGGVPVMSMLRGAGRAVSQQARRVIPLPEGVRTEIVKLLKKGSISQQQAEQIQLRLTQASSEAEMRRIMSGITASMSGRHAPGLVPAGQ